MIQLFLKGLLKKHGSIGLLLFVGDFIVKTTKSKEDDKAWAKAKKFLEKL